MNFSDKLMELENIILLHMQLETRALGLLVSSYCCSTYRVANPFSSLGTFLSSSIGGPVSHSIADCEHLLLCLPGPDIPQKRQLYQGHFSKILLLYAMVSAFGGWLWDRSPDMAVTRWSILLLRTILKWKFLLVPHDADSHGVLLRQDPWEDMWSLERV